MEKNDVVKTDTEQTCQRLRKDIRKLLTALEVTVECLEHSDPPEGGRTSQVIAQAKKAIAAVKPPTDS